MRHPFFSAGRPLVFAHRGGSGLAPENTIAAFDNGLALGADGLELDVHLSSDGVVVVHHDATVDRMTTGRGSVASLTAMIMVLSIPTDPSTRATTVVAQAITLARRICTSR